MVDEKVKKWVTQNGESLWIKLGSISNFDEFDEAVCTYCYELAEKYNFSISADKIRGIACISKTEFDKLYFRYMGKYRYRKMISKFLSDIKDYYNGLILDEVDLMNYLPDNLTKQNQRVIGLEIKRELGSFTMSMDEINKLLFNKYGKEFYKNNPDFFAFKVFDDVREYTNAIEENNYFPALERVLTAEEKQASKLDYTNELQRRLDQQSQWLNKLTCFAFGV